MRLIERTSRALGALLLGAAPAGALERRFMPFAPTAEQEAAFRALADAPGDAFAPRSFATPDGATLPYRLLSPASPSPTPLPLVILLHGAGAIGRDNGAQLDAFAKSWAAPEVAARFRAFVAAPQVAARSADYGAGEDGMTEARPGPSFPALLSLADDLSRRLPVDRDRIYLVGASMGASTALLAASAEPGRFAGVVALAPVPPPRRLAAPGAPVLIVHGTADGSNPIEPARAWSSALARVGGRGMFVEVDGLDHRVPPEMPMAVDWREWLFAQRREQVR